VPPNEPHHITAAGSSWLFVSSSREPRHLFDIVYAVDVLRKRGVPDSAISVFSDHPKPLTFLAPFGVTQVHALQELESTAKSLAPASTAVVVVTGHGGPFGIGDGNSHVSPCSLLRVARSVPNVRACVLVLGQCFAGVFNYLDALSAPPVVILGATNLNSSVSTAVQLKNPIAPVAQGAQPLASWSANLFLLRFFEWVLAPHDVDGDNDVTLVDAYKYAGALAQNEVVKGKGGLFRAAQRLSLELIAMEHAGADPLQRAARSQLLEQQLELLYNHQEAWLLNAHFARIVSFWK
jgi:hypothetical protein